MLMKIGVFGRAKGNGFRTNVLPHQFWGFVSYIRMLAEILKTHQCIINLMKTS